MTQPSESHLPEPTHMLPRRRRRHQCRRPGRQHLNNPLKHQAKSCPQSAGNGADPASPHPHHPKTNGPAKPPSSTA